MTKSILYLGSKSQSRKMLLTEAHIPFVVVEQDADETLCDWNIPLPQLVAHIARFKMDHAILSDGQHEGDICFVLTADTMSHDKNGVIHGKPVDRDDAIAKIKASADGSYLCTAYCLDKKIWQPGGWHLVERIEEVVAAEFIFYVAQHWLEKYLEQTPYLNVSGAMAIEGFGNQFLKTVTGSYTTIIGLPMFEVRESLEKLGFFE